ncbi:MAG: hypothetical protein JKY00_02585 [Roseicyclus sp.]|nr:hypothetical protein [Roseicyclus sp.]
MTRTLRTTFIAIALASVGATASFAGGSSTPNPTAPSTAGPVTTTQPAAPVGTTTFIPRFLTIYSR